jgi:DNA-directed RNA polymerase subunit beta'
VTDAAIKGSVDNLVGLKDNIIIGKRIPAGTGLKRYRDITPTEVATIDSEADVLADAE